MAHFPYFLFFGNCEATYDNNTGIHVLLILVNGLNMAAMNIQKNGMFCFSRDMTFLSMIVDIMLYLL